jgi:hypothetical protein
MQRAVNDPVIDQSMRVLVTVGGADVGPALKIMQDIIKGRDLAFLIKHQALKGTTANCKYHPEIDLPSIIRAPKTLPPNPGLTKLITVVSKKVLKKKPSKLFLMMLPTAAGFQQIMQHFDWVRLVENVTKDQILHAGLWSDRNKTRACMTYAFLGVLFVAMTPDAKLAPPIVTDLVPGHNQTKEFDN